MQMFDVHDELWFHELIFARDHIEAIDIADSHRGAGFGLGRTAMTAVPRFLPLAGASRDHLLAALGLGEPGVGHMQPDGSWHILPPGERSPAALRPQPTKMFRYMDEDGDDYVIFASDEERAFQIYTAYLDDTPALPNLWIAETFDHWQTFGLVRHERQACSRGVEGVGRYSAVGWVVLPIDYDRLALEAP